MAAKHKSISGRNDIDFDILNEQAGFLEVEEDEQVTQYDIQDAVDISNAQKFFQLKLDKFGPYRTDYTRNGRKLLLAGQRGHVAAFDWQTKKLMCELNVMQTVHDITWLHNELFFAVAQKLWTYVYDNQGLELHCLKMFDNALQLQFLPYHFLLVASTAKSYLSWIDVSIGKQVAGFGTGLGRLDVMAQNPSNAIIHLGHPGGTVTLWSPNVKKEPLVKMLCHGSGTRSIAIDETGCYMATSGLDRNLKIWDLRTYKLLHSTRLPMGAGHLCFSQRGLLAASLGNVVNIYQDVINKPIGAPYMTQKFKRSAIHGVSFCPYEDVLGVGHIEGFTSLLVPGAGEPNFDALESNPFETTQQRRQMEVKSLLEKVHHEMITLDTSALGQVNVKSLKEKMDEKAKLLFVKPQKIEFEPRYRKKGKSKAGKKEKRRQGVIEERKREVIRESVLKKQKHSRNEKQAQNRDQKKSDVLDRFKKKVA